MPYLVRYLRRRPTASYMKEELIDEPELGKSSSPSDNIGQEINKPFDNPVFADDEIKVDLGSESFGKAPLEDVPADRPAEMNVYEDNPILYPPDDEDGKHVPKLNQYERL